MRRRFVVIAAVAFVAMFTPAGEPDPPVTIHLRAMSVEAACRRLAGESGVPLQASGPLASEVVLISVENTPLSAVRARLADALRGRWTPVKDGFRLSRPEETTRALKQEDLDRRTGWTKKLLDDERAKLKPGLTPFQRAEFVVNEVRGYPEKMRRWIEGGTNGPQPMPLSQGELLMRQLITAMEPRSLASLPEVIRVDWSNRPGPMELPLPNGATKALEEFTETEAQLAALVDENGRTNIPGATTDDFDLEFFFERVLKPASVPGGIGKLILNGTRFGQKGYYFRMSVYAPSGARRSQVGGSFYFTAADDPRYRTLPPSPPSATASAYRGVVVEPKGLSKEFLEHSRHWDWVQATRPTPFDRPSPPSTELLDFICKPEANEPLGLTVSDVLLAAADHDHANLVACVPDAAHRIAVDVARDGKIALDGFVDAALLRHVLDIRREDGWLTIRPYEPLSAEAGRVPRAALGRLLRQSRSSGNESLRAVAKFYWEAGAAARGSVISGSCRNMLIHSGVGSVFVSTLGLPLDEPLRLLGSLSDAQWRALEDGNPLDVGALSASQKTLLYTRACTIPEAEPGVTVTPLEQERTVARPTGPVPGIPMRMRVDVVPTVQRANADGPPSMWDTPLEIGALRGMVASSIKAGEAATVEQAMSGRYFMGSYRRVHVSIRFAPGYMLEDEWLSEPSVNRTGKPMAYGDLPEGFRRELEKSVAEYLREIR